jgi:hypothetical protein
MTDPYDADRLEHDLNDTAVRYRKWINNRDQWTGFEDDRQLERLRRLADEVAELVRELKDQEHDKSEVEFAGNVQRPDGTGFETYAYFEEGQLLVADDGDEEWVVELSDVGRRDDNAGIHFPDSDGSKLAFLPGDPGAFYDALEEARRA